MMSLNTVLAAALLGAASAAAAQSAPPLQQYLIEREIKVHSHAEKSGFPANRITPVAAVIDPTTAR